MVNSRVGTDVVKAGDVLGRYELVEEIGEGGMATVFRARDRELRRDVAIKVMFPHLAKREETVRRFQREARAAAGLEHANILRVYDVGDHAVPYIVMELVRGRSLLAEVEQRGAMIAEVVACVGALLADALAAAHKAGVIHRDIKPANVLLAGDGRVLLADFGVARLETADSLVTRTGALLGTPAYMSPEQAAGDVTTAKSDLYSLGATLYQLATGVLPFAGPAAKVMSLIAEGQLVSPVRRRAGCGPDLSRAIEHLMRVDPEQRPANAAVVAAELRAIAAAGGLDDQAAEFAAYFVDPQAFVGARLPIIVERVVAASDRALSERKLPRAMALADRASALAPEDPRVVALVDRVIAGGRAGRWRKLAVLGLTGMLAAGGAAAGVAWLASRGTELGPPTDAAALADAARDRSSRDAPVVADTATADAALAPPRPDAGVGFVYVRVRDANPIDAPAVVAVVAPDAGAAPPADAAGDVLATVVVDSDAWCNVLVDGVSTGKRNAEPIRVPAGHHVVRCEQTGTSKAWSNPVDLAAGETKHVGGQLLGSIDVTFEVDATLDGVLHHRGQTVHIAAARHQIGTNLWRDLRASCTVRDKPELDCY
jgi:serine/threonine-protein kinase